MILYERCGHFKHIQAALSYQTLFSMASDCPDCQAMEYLMSYMEEKGFRCRYYQTGNGQGLKKNIFVYIDFKVTVVTTDRALIFKTINPVRIKRYLDHLLTL